MERFLYSALLALALGLAVSLLIILFQIFLGKTKKPQQKEADRPEGLTAFVACSGIKAVNPDVLDYEGPSGCAEKIRFFGGPAACSFACLGGGDCARVCPGKAISIRNGLAVVDRNRCDGCGLCASACPRHLIGITESKRLIYTGCSASYREKPQGSVCASGCTGCRECAAVCPENAITFAGCLPVIDREKCTGCGRCIDACPAKVLRSF